MDKSAISLTCGEQAENHVGMEKVGKGLAEKGFSNEDIKKAKINFEKMGCESELIILNDYLPPDKKVDTATLLIIRNGIEKLIDIPTELMFKEQTKFEWDKKYWDIRRGKVLNKHARYNVCYGDRSQEPDYENKKGTIISYDDVPLTKKWKDKLEKCMNLNSGDLQMEGNYYYNIEKCGIGYHGDGERKKVIAGSLGASRLIAWKWFYNYKQIGTTAKFTLNNGDMYIMSEKATGNDWRKNKSVTLRHAAGNKYV